MDIVPTKKRSQMMASVRSKNTKPERNVRSLLHRLGYRFRIHKKGLPGNPDIVLPKYRVIIFVHGCFWHQHSGCSKSSRPQSRKDFWDKKLDQNIKRDQNNINELKKLGWNVYIIWECQTNDSEQLQKLINSLFNSIIVKESA